MKIKIAIRTDGSKSLGNGHIVRMQALADEFKIRFIDVVFLIKSDDFWIKSIQQKYKLIILNEHNHAEYLNQILTQNQFTHFVYDSRNDLNKRDIEYIAKAAKVKTIVIDTPEDTRLAADCVLYPPIQQVKEWGWEGFKGKLYTGWEYVLLRKEFLQQNPSKQKNGKILLAFGSTDPYFLTEKTLLAIVKSGYWYRSYEFILIVGPQFDRLDTIRAMAEFKLLNITVHQGPIDIAKLYASVDFAFIAFGVTAYELACLHVPMLYISITEDHAKSAKVFEEKGVGINLGSIDTFTTNFENKVKIFLNNLNAVSLYYQKSSFRNNICNWDQIIKVITE